MPQDHTAIEAEPGAGAAFVLDPAPAASGGLRARAAAVATDLQESLVPVVRAVVGEGQRPATLSRVLGIDRTLAARVLRAVRATDSAHILHEIPAPGGLRIFLDAAAVASVGPELRDRAAESVRRFERLIDEFTGGRSALDAALAGLDNGVRDRNSRAAAQAIHKAMTSLLGYQAEVMLASIILQPSASGLGCDGIYVLGKYGVRRLRASSPITVFGRRGDQVDPAGPLRRRVETIDGRSDPENGSAYLLPEFCTRPVPPLSLFRDGDLYLYTLAEDVPGVNSPVNLVSTSVVRDCGLRHRTENTRHHYESQIPRIPCRLLLTDLYVRDDLFAGAAPSVTTTLHSIAGGYRRPDAPAFQLDNVALGVPLAPLGTGLGGVGTRDVPRYQELLGTVFETAGWDARRFRGYRCRVQYPVPLVSVTFWFDLPAAQ